jgi:hypothetical protein
MLTGQPPKPTSLHRLQGTFNVTEHGRDRADEPIAEGDLDAAPRDLTREQTIITREQRA